MWPKSTLDGIRSAISSRKVMSSTMKFQLQRSSDSLISEAELVQEFELSLSRPMGINIEGWYLYSASSFFWYFYYISFSFPRRNTHL